MRFLLIFIGILLYTSYINAQQNNTLFLMHELPQSNYVNPAVTINYKYFIGAPIFGSTHINAYSTGFNFNNLYYADNGYLYFRPEESINSFSNIEILETEIHLSLLSFGYRYKNNYYTFSLNEKVNSYQLIPKNMMKFAFEGNSTFEGETVDLSNTSLNAIHYREYAFGWSKKLNRNFSFGIKGKILFGKGNVYTKSSSAYLYVDENTFNNNLAASSIIYTSFPIDYTIDEQGKVSEIAFNENYDWWKYAMNTQNFGLAADIGFIYTLDNGIEFSASLLDIGYIKWKTDATELISAGSMDLTAETFEGGLDTSGEVFDEFKEVFLPYLAEETYKSPLVPALYIGISKLINNKYTLGATLHNEFYTNKTHTTLTLSGNTNLTENINASISYSIQNKQLNNVGFGVGAKFSIFHFHAISDNIPAFILLRNAKNLNIRFGLSLLWGDLEGTKRKSKDGSLPCFSDPYTYNKKHKK